MRKLASILIALALVLGACPAIVVAEQADAEPETLTYWVTLGSTGASVMSSFDDNLAMQELQSRTGVDLEFIHPAVGQETEQFNLLIASRELPDIIEHSWNEYAGGIQKAIDDGIIIELNDILDEQAPNYAKMLNDYPDLARQVKTDDGTICVFGAYSISDYNCQSGYLIRQDWLDEAGLEQPVTIQDWEDTMLALMDARGLTCGIAMNTDNIMGDMMVGAWKIGSTYYVDEGTVKYGPTQDAYLDFLTTMKEWYDLGIIDADAAAMDTNTMEQYMIDGEAAACFGFAGGNMGNIYTAVEARDQEIDLVGVQYPVLNEGDEPYLINFSWEYRGSGSAAITTACERTDLACKVLDYSYSDEGRILKSYGVEGVSFEYVDGVPTYTDVIVHNPDGLSMSQALYYYVRANYPCVGFIETGYHEQYFARDVQKDAVKLWNTYIDNSRDVKLPMVSLTTEESLEMATMTSLIDDYRKEMVVKFIMGQEPLENFPSFVEQLNELGVNRALEIYQAAYERYLAR